jgi:hypothetical protein
LDEAEQLSYLIKLIEADSEDQSNILAEMKIGKIEEMLRERISACNSVWFTESKPKEVKRFVERLAKLIKNKNVQGLDELNEEMIKKYGVSYPGSALILKFKQIIVVSQQRGAQGISTTPSYQNVICSSQPSIYQASTSFIELHQPENSLQLWGYFFLNSFI